jgi:hypothetical protein
LHKCTNYIPIDTLLLRSFRKIDILVVSLNTCDGQIGSDEHNV